MVNVIVIGDQKFYHDADRTIAGIGHYILQSIGDMSNSISGLAKAFAPGSLKGAVGVTPGHLSGDRAYEGVVGVRNIPKHTKFVYEGTGVFGPLHRPYIVRKTPTHFGPDWGVDRTGRRNPAVGNVMKIPSHGGGHYFRREVTVMGQRPQPFLKDALELARHTEVPLRVRTLAHQIVR